MISKETLEAFFRENFPNSDFTIESVGDKAATLRQPVSENHLRPGGTVSGPVLMAMADAAIYTAILGSLGMVAMAVTTNLNINFMRKPQAGRAVIAECRLLKLGRSLAVGEVFLYSEGDDQPVAHASGTYSIPPVKQ